MIDNILLWCSSPPPPKTSLKPMTEPAFFINLFKSHEESCWCHWLRCCLLSTPQRRSGSWPRQTGRSPASCCTRPNIRVSSRSRVRCSPSFTQLCWCTSSSVGFQWSHPGRYLLSSTKPTFLCRICRGLGVVPFFLKPITMSSVFSTFCSRGLSPVHSTTLSIRCLHSSSSPRFLHSTTAKSSENSWR